MSIWSKKEATPHERARIAGTCNCTRDGVQRLPEFASIGNRAQMAALSDWIGIAMWNPRHGRKGSNSKAKTDLSGHCLAAPQMMHQGVEPPFAACARAGVQPSAVHEHKGGEEVPARIQTTIWQPGPSVRSGLQHNKGCVRTDGHAKRDYGFARLCAHKRS